MKILKRHWFVIYVIVLFILLAMTIAYAKGAELNWVFLPIIQENSPVISVWTPMPTYLRTTPTAAPTMNVFPLTPTPTPVTICIPEPCVP